MIKTRISWADFTWNCMSGCSKVSTGCEHCYAETISLKFGFTKKKWTAANASDNVQTKPHKLREPYKLKKPSRIFVNSMADMYHPLIPESFIDQMFEVMNDLGQHVFQILTKRPRRAARYPGPWTENIWQGTSIENKATLYRMEQLRDCGAHVKFLSLEPLLEPLGDLDLSGFHWVIVGGESGKGYRPMDHGWAREIRDQCVDKGIAFFFKQSAAPHTEMGIELEEKDGTKALWNQYPEKPPPPPSKDLQGELF